MSVGRLNDKVLRAAGFTLQGVLSSASIELPDQAARFRQLLVFAHSGGRFWQSAAGRMTGKNPLDELSAELARDFMARTGIDDYAVLYPGDEFAFDLIALGRELGWHHDSPMAIGIHPMFGTWFAYRVVIAADTDFDESVEESMHACEHCVSKPCIAACPAGAVGQDGFDLKACSSFRLKSGSPCASSCIARLSCPVGQDHRYQDSQVKYHYDISLAALRHLGVSDHGSS
ncbi:MAG: hypothetical protein HOC70_03635 [Gammaproteobacteria bacterium]|jgi:epoxyqueuosine reductase|nr:hypothetical protein [Gammaproteobacteria bacterium]MBT4492310.1 hypothetical protein [Gammaproteobacteria bacterium]